MSFYPSVRVKYKNVHPVLAPQRTTDLPQSIINALKGCGEVIAVSNTRVGTSAFFIPAGALGFPLLQIAPDPPANGKSPKMMLLIYWPDFVNSKGMVMLSAHQPEDVKPTGRRVT